MLNENKNIDELFRAKLGEFEKTPPMYLWTNIQGKLNDRRKANRIAMLKTVSIAAAIVLAFLAGWWMTNPISKNAIRENSMVQQQVVKSNIDQPTNKEVLSVNSGQDSSGTSGIPPKEITSSSTKLSSLATFAANTSFFNNDTHSTAKKSEELVLSNTEKEFLSELHQNFKIVKKLTDWLATVGKDSIVTSKSNSQSVTVRKYSYTTPDKSATLAMNNPTRNNGRWSLKAEFAPQFNNQGQNGRRDALYAGPYNKPQETITENTYSGGMVAGYKIGKRLIVKSGFIYNNIRQSTRNLDFMGVNSLYNSPGNASIASTPAGQVKLDQVGNTRMADAVLGTAYQLNSSAKNSAENVLKQDIEFIEIPLQATYKLIDKKIAVGLTGGISTNILVGNTAFLSENGERVGSGETGNMRNVVYSGAVGLEIGYVITNRITLTVEPRLKQFINSLSTSKSVNYKPSQMGIVTGLTYSFN
ncbi:MAG TPA: hypothetical protein VGK38_08095 [Prolixibacteraceae bacterium]|jgi:hypothetical protein